MKLRVWRMLAPMGLALWLGACTTLAPIEPAVRLSPGEPETASDQPRWWYLRFPFARAGDGSVNSYLDALVADRVISPALDRYRSGIRLWRFHRRWADDGIGHRFSLILFASPPVATAVQQAIGSDPLLQRLRDEGHMTGFLFEPAPSEYAAAPGGSSDRNWPESIRHAWPHFIMGASRTWLELVRAEAAAQPQAAGLHTRYRAVEDSLETLWLREGNHAFLHHLSAIFGYKPVQVIRRDLMQF